MTSTQPPSARAAAISALADTETRHAVIDALAGYLDVVRRSPVQITVVLMSVWWLPQGPIGYLLDSSFATSPVTGSTTHIFFIPVTVNAWHALFHLVSGAIGLFAARNRRSATRFGVVVGVIYFAAVIWAAVAGSPTLGLLPVDTFGSVVHAVEGLIVFVAAVLAVRSRPTTAADRLTAR